MSDRKTLKEEQKKILAISDCKELTESKVCLYPSAAPAASGMGEIPIPLATTLREIINLVGNSAVRLESGGLSYNTGAVALAKGMLGSTTYDFMCNASGTIASNGSGAIIYSLGTALSLMSEGSILSQIFEEVKLVHSHMKLTGVTSTIGVMIIGFNPSGQDSVTTSLSTTTIVGLPVVELVSTPQYTKCLELSSPSLSNRSFANVTSDPVLSPPAGTLGSWWAINRTTFPLSVTCFAYMFRNKMRFRNRLG